jgi:hypothetical protein
VALGALLADLLGEPKWRAAQQGGIMITQREREQEAWMSSRSCLTSGLPATRPTVHDPLGSAPRDALTARRHRRGIVAQPQGAGHVRNHDHPRPPAGRSRGLDDALGRTARLAAHDLAGPAPASIAARWPTREGRQFAHLAGVEAALSPACQAPLA